MFNFKCYFTVVLSIYPLAAGRSGKKILRVYLAAGVYLAGCSLFCDAVDTYDTHKQSSCFYATCLPAREEVLRGTYPSTEQQLYVEHLQSNSQVVNSPAMPSFSLSL